MSLRARRVFDKALLWFGASVIAPLLAGALILGLAPTTDFLEQPSPPEFITCFNAESAVTESTTAVFCASGSISLGESAISVSDESATARQEVHPLLALRFQAAQAAARREGIELYLTSSFRTLTRQAELFAAEVILRGSESEAAKWVLPAQYSHHPQGLALDINYPSGKRDVKWLEINGFQYGLCRVYQNEWWHFEAATRPGTPCPALAANALVDLP